MVLFMLRFAPRRMRSAIIGAVGPQSGAESSFFQGDFDELWKMMNRKGDRSDYEQAHRAEFHQNRRSPSYVATMADTSVPMLCFAGEDDDTEYEPLRAAADELGVEFVSLRGNHYNAMLDVPAVSALMLEFVARVEREPAR